MNFWMKDINYVFSEGPLTKGYYYKTQRILYSKDSITYYKNFEDLMRIISILIYKRNFNYPILLRYVLFLILSHANI